MAEEPTERPEIPAGRVVPMVYGLALANLLGLWRGRGDYVTGFDLFGASAGVLALNRDGFLGALRRFTESFFHQRGRARATGDESYLYALVPGLLNEVTPWLLWSHLLGLVLFVASIAWVARRLGLRFALVCACVLASPAMTSFSIMGFPFLPSATVPLALCLGFVLPESRRNGGIVALAGDVAMLALVTFVAFNGYQSGQIFFVVPALAALTLPDVHFSRRVVWLACSAVVAWLVYTNQAAPTTAALAAVPSDPWAALVEGAGRVAERYLVDWYVDFPALLLAAAVGLVVLRRHRLFWACLLAVLLALCSLSAFQFGGALFGPRRVMPLLFVAAVVAASALAEPGRRGVGRALVAVLVCAGIGYTSYRTAIFATAKASDERRNYNVDRVYSLPYAYSGVDMQIWRDRIHDARVLVDAIRKGPEQHVFFYGFSAIAEDGVNPQLFISRLLLPLGHRRFTAQTVFFDNQDHSLIYLPFTIHPLPSVPRVLEEHVRAPFYLHVKEPEHAGPSIVARFLNRARVTPVDFGLMNFRSYRVAVYATPGPIPVVALGRDAEAPGALRDGLCRTMWRQDAGGYSPLTHWYAGLSQRLDTVSTEAPKATASNAYYIDVIRRRHPAVVADSPAPTTTTHLRGFLWNPGPDTPARLDLVADDDIAVVINGQTVLESLGPKRAQAYGLDVVLPAGWSELVIGHHKFPAATAGTLSFRSTDRAGQPLRWRCPASFPSRE